jgi:carbon-monoxide dehydrogenase medium subunit
VIRSRLSYHAPASLSEASELLASGDAAVLAGGTWLVPLMTRGERSPGRVLDLRGLGLPGIAEDGGGVRIGAMTTYSDLVASGVVRRRLPLLWTAAAGITGGAQIRNLGTIGGSACFATPASDMPACLVALGAVLHVHGASGEREIPAPAFFLDAFRTALAGDELLTALTIPAQGGPSGYCKFKLCEGSWPVVTAAAVGGRERPSVTVGGAQRVPLRIDVEGGEPADVAALVAERLADPWEDELAPARYRQSIAPVIARRALEQMLDREERS